MGKVFTDKQKVTVITKVFNILLQTESEERHEINYVMESEGKVLALIPDEMKDEANFKAKHVAELLNNLMDINATQAQGDHQNPIDWISYSLVPTPRILIDTNKIPENFNWKGLLEKIEQSDDFKNSPVYSEQKDSIEEAIENISTQQTVTTPHSEVTTTYPESKVEMDSSTERLKSIEEIEKKMYEELRESFKDVLTTNIFQPKPPIKTRSEVAAEQRAAALAEIKTDESSNEQMNDENKSVQSNDNDDNKNPGPGLKM